MVFYGSTTFKNNTGKNGGGLLLCDRSYMYLKPHTNITFVNNTALHNGGAIYAEDQCLQSEPTCFFQPDMELLHDGDEHLFSTIHIEMRNNTAINAGSALYGGSVDYCALLEISYFRLLRQRHITGSEIFNQIFTNHSDSDLSFISSDPHGVCLCNSTGQYNGTCYNRTVEVAVFPGQMFSIIAVVVGQKGGTVPGDVLARVTHRGQYMPRMLGPNEDIQSVGSMSSCTRLDYTVRSCSHREVELILLVDQTGDGLDGSPLFFEPPMIHVVFKPCPLGFQLTQYHYCDCTKILRENGVTCNITQKGIHRPDPTYIGFFERNGNITKNGIIFRIHCPFGFCKPHTVGLEVYSNETQDKQCAFNRTGILCGGCKAGLSAVLGSSRCLPCSNYYLFLIIVFGLAGLVLVLLLIGCNLNVAEGTINGLIFYANVVQANYSILFPPVPANANIVIKALVGVLSIFIAWLNLNLGIETCFYDGLDAYVKTWLQFAFPVYIWVLTAVIILLCRKFAIVGRLMGTNAVKVLATLFLLSYAKLLSTIILALQSAVLTYAPVNGTPFHETVWLFDGNQRYLHGKHIFLFLTALMFGLVTLPYTLTLLCLQQLQRNSDKAVFSWVNRLKPILDAYAGPYTDRYRGWTGVMLLARLLLITAYAVNISGDVSLNLLITTSVALCILAFVRGAYKWRVLGLLEGSLILNLGLLSSATVYVLRSGGNQMALTYTSVGFTFVVFILVFAYHAFMRLFPRSRWSQNHHQALRQMAMENESRPLLVHNCNCRYQALQEHPPPEQPSSPVDWQYTASNTVREPLLDSNDIS